MEEQWRKIIIDGQETNYSISNKGNVRNDKTSKFMKVRKYNTILAFHNNKPISFNVIVLLYNAFVDNSISIKSADYIRAFDLNKSRMDIDNLYYVPDLKRELKIFLNDNDISDVCNLINNKQSDLQIARNLLINTRSIEIVRKLYEDDRSRSDMIKEINNIWIERVKDTFSTHSDEEWKPIIYKSRITNNVISSYGKVVNIDMWKLKNIIPNSSGHSSCTIQVDGLGSTPIQVARMELEMFKFNTMPEEYLYVGYRDGNKLNLDINNLYWSKTNMAGINLKDLGANIQRSEIIHQVCKMLEEGYDDKTVIEQFPSYLRQSTISKIRHGLLYTNVSSSYKIDRFMRIDGIKWDIIKVDGKSFTYRISEYGDVACTSRMELPRQSYDGKVILMYQKKNYEFKIDYLVAITFVPNPNNYSDIRHIDGNVNNNHYTNLEWIDSDIIERNDLYKKDISNLITDLFNYGLWRNTPAKEIARILGIKCDKEFKNIVLDCISRYRNE